MQPGSIDRRQFLQFLAASSALAALPASATAAPPKMRLGLVTYQWGKDWDLATIIKHCEAADFSGVELRSTHKHGVEITLDAAERREVRSQFADSPVECVGPGSACEYHSADPEVVRKNIEETKEFIKLSHDIGGTGVKVRPNGFPKEVSKEKTLEQIGKSLREVGQFAEDHGQIIRLEVHGRGTSELPYIRTMLDVADHPAVTVCWNCNGTDLAGEGLEHNFKLVQDSISTVHIHDLRHDNYPWQQLFGLLKGINFSGWTLVEDGKVPDDVPAAMKENRKLWEQLAS